MCLYIIDKEIKEVTEGWKIFEITNICHSNRDYSFNTNSYKLNIKLPDNFPKGLTGLYYDFKFKTNEWIKDTETRPISMWFNRSYPTGFHFYFNKEEAEEDLKIFVLASNITLLPIKVRNVVATGFQDGYKVGVARKIFIEEKLCV